MKDLRTGAILLKGQHKNDVYEWLTSPIVSSPLVAFSSVMGYGVGPYLGLDEIGSPSPMMIVIIISYLFNHTFWIYLLGFSVDAYK